MPNVAGSRPNKWYEPNSNSLVDALIEELIIRPVDDAIWSVTNPIDRLTGKGRATNGQMAFPLGGRYTPRTSGLRAESLQRGDEMIDFEGNLEVPAINPSNRAYNLRNEQDEIVASANRTMYPAGRTQSGSAYVPSMWVREDYRKTPAMFDLYNLLSRGGKTPLRATFANDRLKKVFDRRMKNPPKPPLKERGFFDPDVRRARTQPKEESAMDIVNSTPMGSNSLAHMLAMQRRQAMPRPEPRPVSVPVRPPGRDELDFYVGSARERENLQAILGRRSKSKSKNKSKISGGSRGGV